MIYPGGYTSPNLKKKTTTTYEYDSEGKIVKETVVEEEYSYGYTYSSGVMPAKLAGGEFTINAGTMTPEEVRKRILRDDDGSAIG